MIANVSKKPTVQFISPAYHWNAPQRRATSKILDGLFIAICDFSARFEYLGGGVHLSAQPTAEPTAITSRTSTAQVPRFIFLKALSFKISINIPSIPTTHE